MGHFCLLAPNFLIYYITFGQAACAHSAQFAFWGFVCSVTNSNYPRWSATRKGISLALRSWGVPPQLLFTARRENRLGTGSERQRPARLWLAWLRQAWRHADVWAGWSELAVNRSCAQTHWLGGNYTVMKPCFGWNWKSFGELPLAGFGEVGLTGQLTAPRYLQRRTKAGIERKWAERVIRINRDHP